MQKPKGFGDFFSSYSRIARADGDAGAAATTTTTGKEKWSAEAWAAFIASLGSLFSGIGSGASQIIDSTGNAKQLPAAGVQYMSLPSSNNKTLLWVVGGGVLLLLLVLLVVLRKK